jgi:prepilin-type N-terminal cleavage/methylation domain-containing protein
MKKGFTIIEIVMVIIILGIAMPSIIQGLYNAITFNVTASTYSEGNGVGEELMEEIKARRFDEKNLRTPPPPYWSTIGVDGGENPSDKSTFDDIDDYNGWTDTVSNYSRTVTVFYVTSSDLNNNAGVVTEMKKAAITVLRGGSTVNLVSVFSSHN